MTIQSKKAKGTARMGLDRHIPALLDILKVEIRSFSAVIELLILEERCLVACDSSGLADLVERQADILNSIACLEKSRVGVLERISEETGMAVSELTISRLSRLAAESWRKELHEVSEILSRLYEDMNRKKASNALLIRQGMMMVENDIRTIIAVCGRGAGKRSGYTSSAGRDDAAGSIYLDGKV